MLPRSTVISIYVGPTGKLPDGESSTDGRYTVLPLAGPGDVEKRIRLQSEPGVLAVIDGWFHQRGALSHEEIRFALKMGWQVWGLSAFGAIRAYELRHIGMLGFGQIFEGFCAGRIVKDDEVLFLHSEDPPYSPISEPLVNFREALRQLTGRNAVSEEVAADILRTLSGTWFGHRTRELFGMLLSREGGLTRDAVASVLMNFEPFRLGAADLRSFLAAQPWIDQNALA